MKNAIELEPFKFNRQVRKDMRDEFGLSDRDRAIGCVGRFAYQKNQGFLLRVMKKLHRRSPGYKLVLVGDGADLDLCREYVKENNLESAVIFTGYRTDVNRLMMAFDSLAMPSHFEELGIALIEAQAAGLMCYASNAVPKEAKVTENIEFLPLQEENWMEKLSRKIEIARESMTGQVADAGYDIYRQIKKIEEGYKGGIIDLVTIIIPVYNTATYLDDCLSSIVAQTYSKIEILLINDGSTDNSGDICKNWAEKDNRIKYISKENEGLGPTRNYGVSIASGEYVMFVDSDDWVDETFVEKMYKNIVAEDADVAECNFYRIAMKSGMKSITNCNTVMGRNFTREERLQLGNVSTCKMIIRKSAYVAQPHIPSEDVASYAAVIVKAERIACVNESLYNYRKGRSGSISTLSRNVFEYPRAIKYAIDNFPKQDMQKEYVEAFRQYILRWISRLMVPGTHQISLLQYEWLRNTYDELMCKSYLPYHRGKVLLWGGYNLTRIVQKTVLLEDPYLRFNFSSLAALMHENERGSACPKHKNPYRQLMIHREKRHYIFYLLEQMKIGYIVIDFMEERHDLIELDGNIYTLSDALLESDFPVVAGRVISRQSEECRRLWEAACLDFIEILRKYFKPGQVILCKNLLAERHGDIYHSVEYENISEIREINSVLYGYYEFFRNNFEGIQFIDLTDDELYITDDKYEYGCYPWHLNELVNKKIGESIKMQ
ncbi:glycosyltransferase [Selenomonas ruminantium]|uniref:Glycosyltransferase involved in cell wall bisynthesis n=1 Tax=Selenomonas ruminantium TaxID=971 RepID=A0A1I0YM16_SELRU|nr:glycosyltransferase [Selenomonas ruminantium]SFB13947.1 Glycosyltransferase involved in cell wall bisynthesis [Selenomonas ruminantium]